MAMLTQAARNDLFSSAVISTTHHAEWGMLPPCGLTVCVAVDTVTVLHSITVCWDPHT